MSVSGWRRIELLVIPPSWERFPVVKISRLMPVALLVAAGLVILHKSGDWTQPCRLLVQNHSRLLELVSGSGSALVLLYVLLFALLMMTLVIPFWFCTVAGGFLFGFPYGALYALAGGLLGAIGVYFMTRNGRGAIEDVKSGVLRKFAAGFRSHGIVYLIVLRIIPLFPFVAVNIAPALLGMRPGFFIAGTFLGMIPITLIYANIGANIQSVTVIDDSSCTIKADILVPLAGLAILILLPIVYNYIKAARGPQNRNSGGVPS
jgi:uncharacterized membrane protein YdjX (TVP38/TMEM64 family)